MQDGSSAARLALLIVVVSLPFIVLARHELEHVVSDACARSLAELRAEFRNEEIEWLPCPQHPERVYQLPFVGEVRTRRVGGS